MSKTENAMLQHSDETGGMVRQARGSLSWLAALPFGPKPVFEAEGGSGSGGAGAANGGSGGDGNQGGNGGGNQPVKPEGLSDAFWDAEKGEVKFGDLNTRFSELEAFKAEQDSRLAARPEKPDGYELKLPADFKLPEGFELPAGKTIEINADDPRIPMVREFVHNMGGTQADFERMLAIGIRAEAEETLSLNKAVAEEVAKLGTRGTERVAAAKNWLNASLGPELGESLSRVLFTAKQVEAIERLMSNNRHDTRGTPGAGRDGKSEAMSDSDWEKMTPTQRINWSRSHSAASK